MQSISSAVYQSSECENSSGMHSPQSVRKYFLPISESSSASAASSGVRRLIHTLLPSSSELKPFDEPFPPHEHPQLSLADDISQTVLKRSQNTSFLIQQAEANGASARSPEYLQNLVQHLRFSVPDVFVNDKELTSIIAYALS